MAAFQINGKARERLVDIMHFDDILKNYPEAGKYLISAPEFIRTFSAISVPANTLFVRKNHPLLNVSIICEGILNVFNEFTFGSSYVLDCAYAGDIIGLEAVLSGSENASVSLETITPCVFYRMPREIFSCWMEQDPAFLMKVAQYLGRRHYAASYRSGREMAYPAEYRVIHFLLRHSVETGKQYIVKLTRQQYADATCLSVKTVNRAIAKLEKAGALTVTHGKVILSEMQRKVLSEKLKTAAFPETKPYCR